MQQSQTVYASPIIIIQTSIFRINSERVTESLWGKKMCQAILQQATRNHTDVFNAAWAFYSGVTSKDESKFNQRELILRLLMETWGPFLMKWNPKFFGKNMKPRRWVSRRKRAAMKADFLAIQPNVVELCDDLEQLAGEDANKPKNGNTGFN